MMHIQARTYVFNIQGIQNVWKELITTDDRWNDMNNEVIKYFTK